MLRSSDERDIEFDLKWIPDSFMKSLLTGDSQIPVVKTETGSVKVEVTYDKLKQLKLYLELGQTHEEKLEELLQTLDFMGIYSLKCQYT